MASCVFVVVVCDYHFPAAANPVCSSHLSSSNGVLGFYPSWSADRQSVQSNLHKGVNMHKHVDLEKFCTGTHKHY